MGPDSPKIGTAYIENELQNTNFVELKVYQYPKKKKKLCAKETKFRSPVVHCTNIQSKGFIK